MDHQHLAEYEAIVARCERVFRQLAAVDAARHVDAYPTVVVRWIDTHADTKTRSWTSPAELEDTGDYIVESIGFLSSNLKDGHVTVIQSRDTEGNIDTILHIPVAMVDEIVILTPAATDPAT